MVQFRSWVLFFLFFCPIILAIPVEPIPRSKPGEDSLISAYSPSFIVPELAPASDYYTTRFTHRPSEGLAPVAHINRLLLTTRRKIEFFFRFVTETILPEIRPSREGFVYLRSLEDPLFMSARKLFPTSEKAARSADSIPILKEVDKVCQIKNFSSWPTFKAFAETDNASQTT
ncbi:hypothetical protein HYPSUDRAFT_52360 [Hypholoma sublateritium FD-334 SS-4]|uniref:Uncharacterized protein n=1 Tax=Hypholoma sublateritium (strain FD-334 SS-4) TaxID=945553 RepID=A0A0D2PED3_HYPSF|nr:hypothetical protein HYPSUDRAFT_52360 [Hypholoma sublateritium FD-334 SS-4]